ncbi:MAG: SPOR domain-containing protein [Calditrichaeota bacterium]|nr:SPOR domain-containing protein [Calditrichota bacterium]
MNKKPFLPRVFRGGQKPLWPVLMLLLVSGMLAGQERGDLRQAYENDRLEVLGQWLDTGRIADGPWRTFVGALFESEGETAVRTMMRAFSETEDDFLKKAIQERVARFYSARGYYDTAEKIERDQDYFTRLVGMSLARAGISPAPAANTNSAASDPDLIRGTVPAGGGSQILRGGEETRPTPPPAPVPQMQGRSATANAEPGSFGVQLGAYSSYGNAEKMLESYGRRLNNLEVMIKDRDGRRLYLLVAGGYHNRAEADLAVQQISQKIGVQGYVIQY